MGRALRLLATRARTTAELVSRLTRAGASAEVAGAVCSRLTDLGYLDDESFARRWVEERIRLRPVGRKLLLAELLRKGVPLQIAERSLDAYDAAAELSAAGRLLSRQWRRYTGLDPSDRRRRCYSYLLGRGFDHETSGTAIRRQEEPASGAFVDTYRSLQ